MQRRRGTNHADWYFFTCITKNRLGADKCTGMYAREEDIFHAIYRQLKGYVKEHFISDLQDKQSIREHDGQISDASQRYEEAMENSTKQYGRFVEGKITREELRMTLDAAGELKNAFTKVTKRKEVYEKQYKAFRKLLSASEKQIPISEVMDCINKVAVDNGRKIVVKWAI